MLTEHKCTGWFKNIVLGMEEGKLQGGKVEQWQSFVKWKKRDREGLGACFLPKGKFAVLVVGGTHPEVSPSTEKCQNPGLYGCASIPFTALLLKK